MSPWVLWAHVGANAAIALAYYAIPVLLLALVWHRRGKLPFGLTRLFATFIIACGTTHIMDILVIWAPLYRLQAMILVLTAVVSITTAGLLARAVAPILDIPSPEELREANAQLRDHLLALQELVAARSSAPSELIERLLRLRQTARLYHA